MALSLLLAAWDAQVQAWMARACLPVLALALLLGSLGVPIPEDVPLIGAGVVLRTVPDAVTWPAVLAVALVGIMSGDVILYSAGRRWGRGVVAHRWLRSLITPQRFDWMCERFHRWGNWACFFGRFVMGVRVAMCITAGATHFPFWRFFLADFAGALISVPLFIGLGYTFATALPLLGEYLSDAKHIALAAVALLVIAYIIYEFRVRLRIRRINLEYEKAHPEIRTDAAAAAACDIPSHPEKPRKAPEGESP